MHATIGMTNGHAPSELWKHPDARNTQMWAFKDQINNKYGLKLQTYNDLYQWSIDNVSDFWADTWEFTAIKASKPYDDVSNTFHRVAYFTAINASRDATVV